jgi:hypothetical protein
MGNKTTVYFLPLPAIIRGFLSVFNLGTNAVASLVLALLFFITASLSIWRSIYSHLAYSDHWTSVYIYRLGIVFFSICTPIMAIIAVPGIFWEAIIWGATGFICAVAISILLLEYTAPSFPLTLYLFFAIACGATLFTRATFSFASCWLFLLTTIFLLLQRNNHNRNIIEIIKVNKKVISGVVLFSFFLGFLLLFNFLKWGNPFEFYPLAQYKMLSESELANFKKIGALSFLRIPENFAYFFIPYIDNVIGQPPFIQFGSHHYFTNIGQFNYVEPTLPLSLTIPGTVILAVVGLFFLCLNIRRYRNLLVILLPSVICSLVPLFFILMHHAQSLRYAGDFMPALVIFSGLGLAGMISILLRYRPSGANSIFKSLKKHQNYIRVLFCILFLALMYLQSTYWRITIDNRLPHQAPIILNQPILIQNTTNPAILKNLLGDGWYPPETWGTWSKGNETASLLITPPIHNAEKHQLSLKVNALITASHPKQVLEVIINGQLVKILTIEDNGDHEILIPLPRLIDASRFITWCYENALFYICRLWGLPSSLHQFKLELKSQFPASPSEIGINPQDTRFIGIGLKAVELKLN